ncbi:hypothetical protein Cantr_07299 [Candida viswanathii]|uniref:Uncharacterized protein n=1 Tax=Candida viswanathii TaxID=5486 RepID=A0A367XYS5_9ASCO|nr:hypothetical protein Cantr_07299 [Candida viswanathii]
MYRRFLSQTTKSNFQKNAIKKMIPQQPAARTVVINKWAQATETASVLLLNTDSKSPTSPHWQLLKREPTTTNQRESCASLE